MKIVQAVKNGTSVELLTTDSGETFDVVDESYLLLVDVASELESEETALENGWLLFEVGTDH